MSDFIYSSWHYPEELESIPGGTSLIACSPSVSDEIVFGRDVGKLMTLSEYVGIIKTDGSVCSGPSDESSFLMFLKFQLLIFSKIPSTVSITVHAPGNQREITVSEFLNVDWIITDNMIYIFESPVRISGVYVTFTMMSATEIGRSSDAGDLLQGIIATDLSLWE